MAIDQKRFKAALMLREQGISDVATAIGCTYHHLRFALRGERVLSKDLLEKIRKHLGEPAWKFVNGMTDVMA